MSQQIYVVMGWSGEYSDRREWPVRAYTDESKAKAQVMLLDAMARDLQATKGQYPSFTEEERKALPDPDIQFDYTGTRYFYFTITLVKP